MINGFIPTEESNKIIKDGGFIQPAGAINILEKGESLIKLNYITREEAHKKVKAWIDIDYDDKNNRYDKIHFGKVGLHKVIDEIYDSFGGIL